MKFKKVISLFLAAAIFTLSITAFGETPEEVFGDIAQTEEYTPTDISDFTLWDGESDFKSGVDYYIDSQVDIMKKTTRTLPANSRLVICEGGELRIFTESGLKLNGELLIEPNGTFTDSGTIYAAKGSKITNRGSLVLTPNATVNLHTALDSLEDSHFNCAGTVNIYKNGSINNAGTTTIQSGSTVTATGSVNVPESGNLFVRGILLITLSGTMDVSGYLNLSGELHNSGSIDFREQMKYYRVGSGKLIRSPSGRLTDRRNIDVSEIHESAAPGQISESIKGIDVSRYQNAIDWNAVAKSGVEFTMVRLSLGYLEDANNGQDSRSDYNITEAQKAGIHVGVYHYLKAHNVEDAKKEAEFMVSLLGNYKIDYPVALDFEDPWQQNNLTTEERTEMARVFIDEIKAAGYYPILYTNLHWKRECLDMDLLSDVDIWLAHWTTQTTYGVEDCGIWQYSAEGRVSGIVGDVDLNIGFKDYAKIIEEGGYNHLAD